MNMQKACQTDINVFHEQVYEGFVPLWMSQEFLTPQD